MHLTNPAFLPWAILKEISGTENGHALKNIHQDGLTLEELNKQQVKFVQKKETMTTILSPVYALFIGCEAKVEGINRPYRRSH